MAILAQRPHPKLMPTLLMALITLGLIVAVLGVLLTAPGTKP